MLVELTCTNFTFLFSFLIILWKHVTAQKLKFSIKDFYSKCDQIRRKLWICSHLLKKSLMKNFIFLCSATLAFLVNNWSKIIGTRAEKNCDGVSIVYNLVKLNARTHFFLRVFQIWVTFMENVCEQPPLLDVISLRVLSL